MEGVLPPPPPRGDNDGLVKESDHRDEGQHQRTTMTTTAGGLCPSNDHDHDHDDGDGDGARYASHDTEAKAKATEEAAMCANADYTRRSQSSMSSSMSILRESFRFRHPWRAWPSSSSGWGRRDTVVANDDDATVVTSSVAPSAADAAVVVAARRKNGNRANSNATRDHESSSSSRDDIDIDIAHRNDNNGIFDTNTQTPLSSETGGADSTLDGTTHAVASTAIEFIASAQIDDNNNAQQRRPQQQQQRRRPPAFAAKLPPPTRKSSLCSLLASSGPMLGGDDPLFDDDDDDGELQFAAADDDDDDNVRPTIVLNYGTEPALGPSRREGKTKTRRRFHCDGALTSWVWTEAEGGDLPKMMGRASAGGQQLAEDNADRPLLATVSDPCSCVVDGSSSDSNSNSNLPNDDDDLRSLEDADTNLSLLHTTTKTKSEDGRSRPALYRTRHASLAPLLSVSLGRTTSAPSNNEEEEAVVSVFDVTPGLHRPLHQLLRTTELFDGSPPLLSSRPDDDLEWHCDCDGLEEDDDDDGGGGIARRQQPPPLPLAGILDDLRRLAGERATVPGDDGPTADRGRDNRPLPNLSLMMRRLDGHRPWRMFAAGSSGRADKADLRVRFLALQLFHAVNFCHSKGVTLGQQLSPDRIFVQDDGWLRLVLPIVQWKPESDAVPPESEESPRIRHVKKANAIAPTAAEGEGPSPKRQWRSIFRLNNDGSPHFDKFIGDRGDRGMTILPYPGYGDPPTVQWQRGQLTNLCYLMTLNATVGRTVGDLANPPILPWVTDFSSRINVDVSIDPALPDRSCWRDLSKSKFRLKKGDEQLDQTFAHASPPHHVPEGISELTYAVYRARCLPINRLRSVVRRDFVSGHYPAGLRALYEWTPDEATIEFYAPSDPCVFRSMHNEMDDLALPPWCEDGPEGFVAYHRRLLESDDVGRRLYSWIDLNFGEALTGKRAIAEKNVVLSALPRANGGCRDRCQGGCHSVFAGAPVDKERRIASSRRESHHFVQLFCYPHPRKNSDLRNTVSSVLRTAFHQSNKEQADAINDGERGSLPYEDGAADFQLRKQRDVSTVGAILKDCYLAARVIPPPAVDFAIKELLSGSSIILRQSLKDLAGDGWATTKSFPLPPQLRDAYQILSNSQLRVFQRGPIDADVVYGNASAARSTALEQVWRLIQSSKTRLESLSSTCVDLILPTLLMPLKSIVPFVENCIGAHYSSFTDRLVLYLTLLSKIIISADLIVPLFFKFLDDVSTYASNEDCPAVIEELGKIVLSRSLISSVYSCSTGDFFIAQATAFATKQLCTHATRSKPDSQLKSMSVLFISLLAHEEILGSSICCKYIVPSLLLNIEKQSTIECGNAIAQALKSLIPFLQRDIVGVLICKEILLDIMPRNLVVLNKPKTSQNSYSSAMKTLCLIKHLTDLLRNCLSYLDSKSIMKYFHSNLGSMLQLLSVSFEVASRSRLIPDGMLVIDDCASRFHDSSEELLKDVRCLVRDVICRIDACHYSTEIFPIVEKLSSQVNDTYLSISLNQSAGWKHDLCGTDEIMSLPGIKDTFLVSYRLRDVCEREQLELHCPSALEFLAWANPARGIQNEPNIATPRSALDLSDANDESEKSTPYNDHSHEIIDGDGMLLEMRAPKRQTYPVSAGSNEDDDLESKKNDHIIRAVSSDASISGFMLNENNETRDVGEQSKSKRKLAWLLGLHKEKRENVIRYVWQPRMMLATELEDKKSGPSISAGGMVGAITSMATNGPESMLVAGNSQGEVLLFDLRRHPPVLEQKTQFNNGNGIPDNRGCIRQVEFFDKHNILVCNGGLHLFSPETQTILSSLSPKNVYRHDSTEMRSRSWRGDNFIAFSVFPKGTGSREILCDSHSEFAAISSSHVYSIDVRCPNSIASVQSLLLPNNNTMLKRPKFDQMFRALTWTTAPLLGREECTKSKVPLRVRDDKTSSFDLLCVTTHGEWICTGSISGHIHCFDRRHGKVLHCWKGHTKSVEYLKAISRHRLISAGGDKTSVLWDMTKTPPQKISSVCNIPGKESATNITSHQFSKDGLVSILGDNNLVLCAAAGRKAVFMPMPQESQPFVGQQPTDVMADRIVMSDFEGNQIPSSEKLNISSIAMLPYRQLVLLGCEGKIHVCM